MALTLAKLRKFVRIRNASSPGRRVDKMHFFDDLALSGIALSDLGAPFVFPDRTFWQTPYGDLIQGPDGTLRINDEGQDA